MSWKMNFIHLTNSLSRYAKDKILFIGLGNDIRGDDLAGIFFTNLLKTKSAFKESNFIIAGKNPENYLGEITNLKPEAVVFADAASWGGLPGEISLIESENISDIDFSTHAYSIKLVEKFLLLNNRMDFYYIGIQTKSTELCKEMSSEVMSAIKNFFNEDGKAEER